MNSDEPGIEGDRVRAGQRYRQAAGPDPGGERHDQRIEPEPPDDDAVQA